MQNLGHISVIEFEEIYGKLKIEKVAIFNANKISEEEALKMIHLAEYNENILVMDKKQWINIFRNGTDN